MRSRYAVQATRHAATGEFFPFGDPQSAAIKIGSVGTVHIHPIVIPRGEKAIFHPRAFRELLGQLIDVIQHLRFKLLGTVLLRNREHAFGIEFRIGERNRVQQIELAARLNVALRNAQFRAFVVRPESFGSSPVYSVRASCQRLATIEGFGARNLRGHRRSWKSLAQGKLKRGNSLPRRFRFIVQGKTIVQIEIIRCRENRLFPFGR